MDGSIVSGIQLKVTLARRQPVINPINDATSSAVWTTLGRPIFTKIEKGCMITVVLEV